MKNKSKIYGYYGGVAANNFYVPPGNPDFTPLAPPVILTEEEKLALAAAIESIKFYSEHAQNIMLRTSTVLDSVATFTITTSANPVDKIVYTAEADGAGIDLNKMDGGFF